MMNENNNSNTYSYSSSAVMNSRDKILATVKQNQPAAIGLPKLRNYEQNYEDVVEKFVEVLRFIGGEAHIVNNDDEIENIIKRSFHAAKRIVSTSSEFSAIAKVDLNATEPHGFADVDLFITTSDLAVAENGAVWIKDEQLPSRVLPFISQQLAVIISKENIVSTMHEAYEVIGSTQYAYAVFIAGPSKTADIAQSLVLGAHGPKTMTVFII